MSRYRVLVVDDETEARRGLRGLLSKHEDVEVIGECADGTSAVKALDELRPDIAFLDIQMPDMSGFDVLARLDPEKLPVVVFVTAFDQYSLKAFEVQAIDYLLKPFSDARFLQALERAKEHCSRREAEGFRKRLLELMAEGGLGEELSGVAGTVERASYRERFVVGSRDDVRFVDAGAVRWIEADAYRVRIHCRSGSYRLRGNIGRFEGELDPMLFFRIGRSAIVNLAFVRSVRTSFGDRAVAVLDDGTELKVSRSRRSELIARLERSSS